MFMFFMHICIPHKIVSILSIHIYACGVQMKCHPPPRATKDFQAPLVPNWGQIWCERAQHFAHSEWW